MRYVEISVRPAMRSLHIIFIFTGGPLFRKRGGSLFNQRRRKVPSVQKPDCDGIATAIGSCQY